ncbi:MAG: bifunctional folylpolyglutamate synthase/dihydrofolate synthase [Caulobacteraceae bacterium]
MHPLSIDLSLSRVERLLEALGRPQDRLPPVIHVAGTNGKGSTCAFIRAIAEAAGLKVHVFSSPHLVRFAERIRLAGVLISDAELARVLAVVEDANAGQPITFFEITTAAALLVFSQTPAGLAVIEVGLGGRWDASNVFKPEAVACSVICPVDYDHKEFLGDDLAVIAGDKAGVIKPGRPVVSARQQDVAAEVIEGEAERMGAPLWTMGQDFDAFAQNGRMVFQDQTGLEDLPAPGLAGAHQIANAGLAIAAVHTLNDRRFTHEALAKGVASATWPARMQRLTAGPYGRRATARGADLWLDGGHNPHAARALADTLASLAQDGRPVTLICGLLKNKDAVGFFGAFAELRPRILAIPFAHDAAADPQVLAQTALAAGLMAQVAENLDAALDAAFEADGPPPHVVIGGSLYLAGEVLAAAPETWPV